MKAFYRLFYYVSILLTAVLAGFTIAGAFACDVSPESSQLIPFIGLAIPGLLLVNLTVALYWAIRWRCWVLIPLIAIGCNWTYLSNIFQFPLFDSASEPKVNIQGYTPGTLTVSTYNVGSFRHEQSGFISKSIADFMKNSYADILCFQEFGIDKDFNVDSLKVAFAQWPYSYIPPVCAGTTPLQLAVFSRYPILSETFITYPESNNCSLWCDIAFNGHTIRLFNNHLQTTEVTRNRGKLVKELQKDNSEGAEYAITQLTNGLYENFRKRATQASVVNKLVTSSPHPTLVCGDFNSLPSSRTYHEMKGNKLKDGFQTCGHGYMYTFRHFKHLLRIDYILHSAEFKGIDYFSPDVEYSDHNPVIMRMKL